MANCSNVAAVTFPANTGALEHVEYFGLGYASAGAGVLFASAALTNHRDIATGATPSFAIGELDVNLTTTSSEFEAAFLVSMLGLYFKDADHANIGDAGGLHGNAVPGSIYVSLHTANPAGGNQTTSEAAYTSYLRVAVARSAAGWAVV